MKEKLRVDMKIWIANILTAIMCYGYALANCSIGVDDESIPRALSGRLFETGRFGIHLVNAFFDISDYLPWIYLFLCLSFICVGNAILMSFWKKYINGYDEWVGILFCIMVISYPGFAYKFIFTVNLVQMGIVYL